MRARVRRTVRSLVAVFVAFWGYRLLVAPWIDPSFVIEARPSESEPRNRADSGDDERRTRYARIFAPGSWELEDPIMLESGGVELLMKDYENLPGGKIRLPQCTVLYVENRDGADPEKGRVVVVRAHEGALLQFDSEMNLRRGKVGKLIGGQLHGKVTIEGTPSKPGADDGLFVATQDVQLTEQKVWSHSRVDFRYGPNEGQGRELIMYFFAGEPASPSRRGGNLGGFERIELRYDVRMHMQPDSTGLFPGDTLSGTGVVPLPDPATGHIEDDKGRIDISCQGPFCFDLKRRQASFANQVFVDRAIAPSIHDRMTCDELQILFGERPQAGVSPRAETTAGGQGKGGKLSLQVVAFKAIGGSGNPVTVDAPSNELQARANEIEYEIPPRRVRLQAGPRQPEAVLTWKKNRFGGRSLTVERPQDGTLPLAASDGEGWCEVVDDIDSSNVIEARWSRAIHLEPGEHGHVLSLLGNAHAKSRQTGELSANEIQLWLVQWKNQGGAEFDDRNKRETASRTVTSQFSGKPAQPRYPVSPSRLLAQGNVRFDSPRLSGDAQILDIRFDPAGALRATPQAGTTARARLIDRGLSPSNPLAPPPVAPRQAAPSNADSIPASSEQPTEVAHRRGPNVLPDYGQSMATTNSQQHFELHGNSILVELISQGRLTNVNHVTIDGSVYLRETRTAEAGEIPIEVHGNWLQVKNAVIARQTTVAVRGNPASIAARGMEMTGGEILMDRGRNLVWIDGAGRTVLPSNQVVQPSARPASGSNPKDSLAADTLSGAPLSVTFERGMSFNGKVARFEQGVKVDTESHTVQSSQSLNAQSRMRTLATDVIEVTMKKPIDLAADTAGEKAEVEQIMCIGPVVMNERTSDQRGLVASESLTTRDLSIQQSTGEIHAVGPGTLESTRLASDDPFAGQAGFNTASATADQREGPVYVRVDYQGNVTGNTQRGEIVLHDDIRGIYGPVAHWHDKLELSSRELEAGQIGFFSDLLTARQTPGASQKTAPLELEAGGNVEVYGQTFSAQANRLTYVQEKKQLIFEGDSRSGAELYYQPQAGAAWTRARAARIEYWPGTRQTNIRDAQFLDLGQIGNPGPPRLPNTAAARQ